MGGNGGGGGTVHTRARSCVSHTAHTNKLTQIPWGLPGRLPIELEFSGVRAVAAARPEGDWSARAASDRAASAARAQLAAAEAALLAALTAGGNADDRGDRGGGLAGLLASAAGAALGRLALTVSDVHLRFEGLPDGAGGVRAAAGLLVASVSTDAGGGGGDAAFAKAFSVEGACVYWAPTAPPPGTAPRPPTHPPCAASDVVLGPLAARVRVAVGGGAGPRARVAVAVGEAAAAARPAAVAGAAAALDAVTVWRLRRDGAPWRPAGWRDGRGGRRARVPPAALWRYAAAATLAAHRGAPPRGPALSPTAHVRPGSRRRYVELYAARLTTLTGGGDTAPRDGPAPPSSPTPPTPPSPDPAAAVAELADLEAALGVTAALALRSAAADRVRGRSDDARAGGGGGGPARLLAALPRWLGRVPAPTAVTQPSTSEEARSELEHETEQGVAETGDGESATPTDAAAAADGPPPPPSPPPPPPSIVLSLSIDTAAVSLLDAAGRAVATLELDRAAARAKADAAGAVRARARASAARASSAPSAARGRRHPCCSR